MTARVKITRQVLEERLDLVKARREDYLPLAEQIWLEMGFTLEEVAFALGTSERSVRRATRDGRLRCVATLSGRPVYSRESILEFSQ
jgi:hypothetical protein